MTNIFLVSHVGKECLPRFKLLSLFVDAINLMCESRKFLYRSLLGSILKI